LWQYLLGLHGGLLATLFYTTLLGLTLFLFGMFHVSLVARNVTTNETFKWDDAQRIHNAALRRAGQKGGGALRNRYNRGLWENFAEVLFPATARKPPQHTQ
jgi:hypothetical protein